jgi:hypothetical protein
MKVLLKVSPCILDVNIRTTKKIRKNNDQSDPSWNGWKKYLEQTPTHTKFEKIKV